MSKIFAILAVLLILSGALVLALPREAPPTAGPRGLGPTAQSPQQTSTIATVRQLAEQANAPLSIIFGLISLYYSRRTYVNSQRMADKR